VYVSPSYLVFSLNAGSKTTESSVHIKSSLFATFAVTQELPEFEESQEDPDGPPAPPAPADEDLTGEFAVSLDLLLSSLTLFGHTSLPNTHLTLTYSSRSSIFTVTLEDPSGILSSTAILCSAISDGECNDTLNSTFQSEPIVARTILKSCYLRDAFNEIKTCQGCDFVTFAITDYQIQLSAEGDSISSAITLPRSRNVFLSLGTSPPITHVHRYNLKHFDNGMRGLDVATETCLQMNRCGVLAIQHSVVSAEEGGEPCFVDFILAPAVEDENDEYDVEYGNVYNGGIVSDSIGQTGFSMGYEDEEEEEANYRGQGGTQGHTHGHTQSQGQSQGQSFVGRKMREDHYSTETRHISNTATTTTTSVAAASVGSKSSRASSSRKKSTGFSPVEDMMGQRKSSSSAGGGSAKSSKSAKKTQKSQAFYSDDDDTEGEDLF
jgi:hypothetical protein